MNPERRYRGKSSEHKGIGVFYVKIVIFNFPLVPWGTFGGRAHCAQCTEPLSGSQLILSPETTAACSMLEDQRPLLAFFFVFSFLEVAQLD